MSSGGKAPPSLNLNLKKKMNLRLTTIPEPDLVVEEEKKQADPIITPVNQNPQISSAYNSNLNSASPNMDFKNTVPTEIIQPKPKKVEPKSGDDFSLYILRFTKR